MVNKEFNNNVSQIKKAIKNDKLVIFAGAGVSRDSGIPLWDELIKNIKDSLNEEIEENDPLKIAQIFHNEKGEKGYMDLLKSFFYENRGSYNPLHEILFKLNPQHIITTNYDNYFENIIENRGLPFSIVSKDIDLPYAEHKKLLIKYHGDFENKNIVLKETDYLEFSKNNTLKETFVKSLFSNKIILFVGYNVGDINLKLLIRDVQFILTKHHQRAYLLSHRTDFSVSEIKYFENLGINIINYSEDTLKHLQDIDTLSEIGNAVYKQLKYIQDFDLFEFTQNQTTVYSKSKTINDLYTSLNRFKFFKVLPKAFLASLYPLNKGSETESINNIEGNTLVCYNHDLLNILKEYEGQYDKNFTDEEKDQLNHSIFRLIISNISEIGEKTGIAETLGYRATKSTIHLLEKYFINKENCEEINHLISNLKYSDALKRINKYQVTDCSKLRNDLVYAYSLYKFGEYYKAYKTYEQIEIKSNRLKQMDVSFLSLYNMKRIGILIRKLHFFDNRYQPEDLKYIYDKAKEIDLDKELIKIKFFVDEDVYTFLKEIRDGIYIQRLCNEIDDIYYEIQDHIKSIKKGDIIITEKYSRLHNTLSCLYNYLEYNFIIGNGFTAIEYSFDKSIKTFILGIYIGTLELNYYQSQFGTTSFENFNSFLFKIILNYTNPKELAAFIKEQNIIDIKFSESSKDRVCKSITNLLTSFYRRNDFLRDEVANDAFINYFNSNNNFHRKVLKQFKNICIVLTYFKFEEKEIRSIYSHINRFISLNEIKQPNDFNLLWEFIDAKFKIIGYDLLHQTLQILASKNLQFNNLYISVLQSIKKLKPKFINHHFLEGKLESIQYEEIKYSIPTIYHTLSKGQKKNFLKMIEEQLSKNLNLAIVFNYLNEEIPISTGIKMNYMKDIHGFLQINDKGGMLEPNVIYFIIQYFELIHLRKIEDEKLPSLDIKSELFKFLFNPKDYNENNFNVTWLKYFYRDSFLHRLANIDYILKKLELFLIENKDDELIDIYFKLINLHSRQRL